MNANEFINLCILKGEDIYIKVYYINIVLYNFFPSLFIIFYFQFTIYGVYFGVISIVLIFANTIRCFGRQSYDELESPSSELCNDFPLLQSVR